MTARLCSECVNCEACENPAYCLDDTQPPPCPHDRTLCAPCALCDCEDCMEAAAGDLLPPGVPLRASLAAQAAWLAGKEAVKAEEYRTLRESQATYAEWARNRKEQADD